MSAPDNTDSLAYTRDGRRGRFTGTSAAAPHVAGFAALLKQLDPDTGAAGLRRAVESAVVTMGGSRPNTRYGRGRIDGAGVDLARAGGTRNDDPPVGHVNDDEVERALRDILRQ